MSVGIQLSPALQIMTFFYHVAQIYEYFEACNIIQTHYNVPWDWEFSM